MLNETIISVARTLLLKNIAFCIYRYPEKGEYRLAIDPKYRPHEQDLSFWMAPFTPRSEAKNIFLSVIRNEFLNEAFLLQMQALPAQEGFSVGLPAETSKEEYFMRLKALLKDIHSNRIQKAILSREFNINKPEGFDPLDCFECLAGDYPQTFVHFSHHPKSGMWMGATPELLLKKRDSELSIMALAGTQARKNGETYRWREKEKEEHAMVGQHIEAVFEKYGCTLIKKNGPEVIESGRVAHLKTDYLYQDNAGIVIKEFLAELHPTPAVGGLPVDTGVDCILEHEGYDRRYYCGFIGETDFSKRADLYINLRCMQIGEEKIAIYVGGGITAASDPQEEWDETILKSKTMIEKIIPVKELY